MSPKTTTRPRNGSRHGDVSYISLGLPDLARGRAFYGTVLGWRFSPGSSEHGAQVDDIVPMIGLWDGEAAGDGRVHGAVLAFRVDDLATAVAAVRAHGGTISDPHQEPYALAAEGHDDQGIPFSLHEMPSILGDGASAEDGFHNGEIAGDVSYLTMVLTDLDAAHGFYGGVLGWSFNIGRAGGAQVSGVAPQIGMTTQPEAGPATPGVILCYRVDDMEAAVRRVRDAVGEAGSPRRLGRRRHRRLPRLRPRPPGRWTTIPRFHDSRASGHPDRGRSNGECEIQRDPGDEVLDHPPAFPPIRPTAQLLRWGRWDRWRRRGAGRW